MPFPVAFIIAILCHYFGKSTAKWWIIGMSGAAAGAIVCMLGGAVVEKLFESMESLSSPGWFQALLNTAVIGALVGGVVPVLFRDSLKKEGPI